MNLGSRSEIGIRELVRMIAEVTGFKGRVHAWFRKGLGDEVPEPQGDDDESAGVRNRFSRNVGWNVFGNAGGKLFGPLFQLLIARLLLPEEVGIFAIALAWLALFDIGKDWGLGQAIVVRRGQQTETALQFTMQLSSACIFYGVTFVGAPFAARQFGLPELNSVLPLAALAVFLNAVADPIVTDCLTRQHYRRLAIRQIATPLVSGVTGLILASMGYGVYSLLVGLLVGQAIGTLTLVLGGGIRSLGFVYDRHRLKELMSIGKHVILQRFFGFLAVQADSLVVARALGSPALGLYRTSNILAYLAPTASVTQAEQVVFTELSANRSAAYTRKRYNLFTNVAGPALLIYSIAVYLASPSLVPVLLGSQWEETVPLIQVFATGVITGFLTPLNIDLAKVLGFAGTYTRYAALRSIGTIIVVLIAAQYSTAHVGVGMVIAGLVSNLANDTIFYMKQEIVPLTRSKVAIIAASWAWAAFVIIGVLPGI